jgi:hypothetical protein
VARPEQHRKHGQMEGLVGSDDAHSTVAKPGLVVTRSSARMGQRRSMTTSIAADTVLGQKRVPSTRALPWLQPWN